MATVTIENVPDNIVKSFGDKILYDEMTNSFLPKKRLKVEKYIKSSEYLNDSSESFSSMKDLILDLKKQK